MDSMFLTSGYVISAMDQVLKQNPELSAIVKHLCTFEVNTSLFGKDLPKISSESSVLAVLHNLVNRGSPTYASTFIEERVISKRVENYVLLGRTGRIGYGFADNFDTISVTDEFGLKPAISAHRRLVQKQKADSKFEWSLLGWVEDNFGIWPLNLIHQQVNISDLTGGDNEFLGQRVDYVFAFPNLIENLRGIVIEMDGPQHQTEVQERDLDRRRNNVLLSHGYDTIRIQVNKAEDWSILKGRLSRYFSDNSFSYFRKPELSHSNSTFYELVFRVIKIAQIQSVVLRSILSNPKWLQLDIIRFGLIERDCEGLDLAIHDLNNWFQVFSQLTPSIFPKLEIEQIDSTNHLADHGKYQAILDVACYQGFDDLESFKYPNLIELRSAPLYARAERRFMTGELIQYNPFGSYENSKWVTENDDAVSALTYVLQSVFRKESFRDGQLPILNRALQLKSVIGLLPTGAGKSLTYQLSALMQPGVCMVIDPIISLMHDQFTGLNNHRIDCSVYINSTIKTPKEKSERQKLITEAGALFFFISPERLLIDDFRSYLSSMSENNENPVFFNYCVIDEAHCVSEWGHDFRTSYLSVAENASRYCKVKSDIVKSIPIFALTATASYDVLSDIQRELSGNDNKTTIGEEAIIQYETSLRGELSFQVIGMKDMLQDMMDGYGAKENLSTAKKEIIQSIIESHRYQLSDGAGLIFCPHRSHMFGITDRFKNNDNKMYGVLDYLIAERVLPSTEMGFFMGSDETNEQVQKESMKNQDAFINNEKKLLVATKAFGMGIDKENIRFTVHVNYPASIESFLQEAGRAGRDRNVSNCYLLFSNSENPNYQNLEFEVNQYFHERSFRGQDKEKAVLQELLYEINDPDRTYQITTDLQDKFFEEDIVVNSYSSRTGRRYVALQRSDREKIADLMVSGNWPIYYASNVTQNNFPIEAEKAKGIMEYLKDILKTKGSPDNAWKWLHSTGDKRPGILELIKKGQCTATYKSGIVTVTWQNNITERTRMIQQFIKIALKRKGEIFNDSDIEKIVSNAVSGASSAVNFNDLVDTLNTKLKNYDFDLLKEANKKDAERGDTRGTLMKNLEFYYNQLRDKTDTEKAIYRLRLIGIIDDYTVDYRTQSFTLYFSKKSDSFFTNRLKSYLSKFMSDDRVEKEISKAKSLNGDQLVVQYLHYLVDYSYAQIAKKRERSIQDMRDACIYGLEKNAQEFAEYLDLYLNSKYFRDEYFVVNENQSLRYQMNDGKVEDMKFFWHYVELMTRDGNSEINNLKHLRGASLRMLRVTTQNPVLLTLAAYATFLLDYKSTSLVEEAHNNLSEALENLEIRLGWNEDDLENLFNDFVKILTSKKPEVTKYYSFEFDSFRLNSIHKSLVSINENVNAINNKMLRYG